MFCKFCGNKIDDGSKFCSVCGRQAMISSGKSERSVYNQQPKNQYQEKRKPPVKKKKGVKPAVTFLLGIAVMATIVAGLWFAGIVKLGVGNQGTKKIEGDGYATPEEAAMAYVEALKEQDLDKMLSTFAVETYCEKYNTEDHIRRVGSYSITDYLTNPISPASINILKDKNAGIRQSDLIRSINYLLLALTICYEKYDLGKDTEILEEVLSGNSVFNSDSSNKLDPDQIVSDLCMFPDTSSIQIEGIIYPEDLSQLYLQSANLSNMKTNADIMGAEGFKSLGVLFSMGTKRYLATMDTVRYNGRWYNLKGTGMFSTFLGLSITSGGVVPYDEVVPDYNTQEKITLAELRSNWEKGHSEYIEEYGQEIFNAAYDQQLEEEKKRDLSATDKRKSIFAFSSFEEFIDYFGLTELE